MYKFLISLLLLWTGCGSEDLPIGGEDAKTFTAKCSQVQIPLPPAQTLWPDDFKPTRARMDCGLTAENGRTAFFVEGAGFWLQDEHGNSRAANEATCEKNNIILKTNFNISLATIDLRYFLTQQSQNTARFNCWIRYPYYDYSAIVISPGLCQPTAYDLAHVRVQCSWYAE